jgi:glucose-1-phosphate adenylyltransferase
MSLDQLVVIILAGGVGGRLFPLTKEIPKPALLFGGEYHLVDFPLSNFKNSGIKRVFVSVKYEPETLVDHLDRSWKTRFKLAGGYLNILEKPGDGTAHAISENWENIDPALAHSNHIAIFGADHVYRMDVKQMFEYHRRADADLTISAVQVPKQQAPELGVCEVKRAGKFLFLVGFYEKPKTDPKTIPDNPEYVLGSMGNYIFKKAALKKIFGEGNMLDFGKDVVPYMLKNSGKFKIAVYNFNDNLFPGITPEEIGYWLDVGTIATYFEAHMDLCRDRPRLNVFNSLWPIMTGEKQYGGFKTDHYEASERNCWIPRGAILSDAQLEFVVAGPSEVRHASVRNSIIGENVVIGQIQDGTGRNIHIENAIIDSGARIMPGVRIDSNRAGDWKPVGITDVLYDLKSGLFRSNGTTIVPRNAVITP